MRPTPQKNSYRATTLSILLALHILLISALILATKWNWCKHCCRNQDSHDSTRRLRGDNAIRFVDTIREGGILHSYQDFNDRTLSLRAPSSFSHAMISTLDPCAVGFERKDLRQECEALGLGWADPRDDLERRGEDRINNVCTDGGIDFTISGISCLVAYPLDCNGYLKFTPMISDLEACPGKGVQRYCPVQMVWDGEGEVKKS